jgi:hypothetical protein
MAGALEAALAPLTDEALVVRVEAENTAASLDLIVAYGPGNGERGGRDGDIGTERQPVREFFRYRPEYSRESSFSVGAGSFACKNKAGVVIGTLPAEATVRLGSGKHWDNVQKLLADTSAGDTPVAIGTLPLSPARAVTLALQNVPGTKLGHEVLSTYREVAAERAPEAEKRTAVIWKATDVPQVFDRSQAALREIARRVTIETPDPYLNAAMPALNIAADAVWDTRQKAYVHGGVAWRVRLLGWRVGYAGDTLGWHDRTRAHFDGYAAQQNTAPVPSRIPAPEPESNLARNENALHSNGDMTKSHYDMNLVGVDVFFRHLLWTGDLEYARRNWPVIERHLAWERRLFRREFGPEKLPLYEAYCCIWASDDLAYNGGGVTHSTAYNLYHNRLAARVARLIGADPKPYEAEASLIERGLHEQLWLRDRGWFAEWKDLLGRQLVHPNAALWTFYHTVDSEVPSCPAWRRCRSTGCPTSGSAGRRSPTH